MIKNQKSCAKHIYLVTDDGLYDRKAFYTIKLFFIHPALFTFPNISHNIKLDETLILKYFRRTNFHRPKKCCQLELFFISTFHCHLSLTKSWSVTTSSNFWSFLIQKFPIFVSGACLSDRTFWNNYWRFRHTTRRGGGGGLPCSFGKIEKKPDLD